MGGGCTSYGIPGLRPSQRKARNGPPTGWAGWGRGQVPFGKRRRKTIPFPTFSSRQRTTSPARPSWWAGHEALVLEAAGQVRRLKNHAASTTVQRKGVWGKETLSPTGSRGRTVRGTVRPDPTRSTLILSPLVLFPPFLQRNGAPPGRAPFPPVPTALAMERPPTKGDRIS